MAFAKSTTAGFAARIRALGAKLVPLAILPLSAVLVLQVLPASAATATNPFPAGQTGYDASYPQCPQLSSTSGASFAIIGLGHGRPFTENSCAPTLWGQATTFNSTGSEIAAYFNTGYSGAYSKDITTPCLDAEGNQGITGNPHVVSQEEQAWAIGCSEADYAMAYALSFSSGAVNPAMWWADVETGNSWSTNVLLNQWTINGITDELATPVNSAVAVEGGHPVGIYSYPAAWNSITGGGSYQPTSSDASWLAGTSSSTCSNSAANFDGQPLWVLQYGGFPGGGDQDTAC